MFVRMISAEADPWALTGGLGEVVSALSKQLVRQGHKVSVCMPRYPSVELRGMESWLPVETNLNGKRETGRLWRAVRDGISFEFVDAPQFFNRAGLYGEAGRDFPDNDLRFGFLAHAALQASLSGSPPDILHAHDWHAGLVPVLVRDDETYRQSLRSAGLVFTIHNLAYQGLFPSESVGRLGLRKSGFAEDGFEFYNQLSFMKAGLAYADQICTVSPTYAREILLPAFGCGVDGFLRKHSARLRGILNGIDVEAWNPAADTVLPARYGPADLGGKAACKQVLKDSLGLAPKSGPLAIVIGRMAAQKGLAILAGLLENSLCGFQWAVLGSGEQGLEMRFKALAEQNMGHVALRLAFDVPLSRRLYAAGDLLVMPSVYEPCGLAQMIASRYGTLPLVHATGGLADTVTEDPRSGASGFTFTKMDPEQLSEALARALAMYGRPQWLERVKNAMARDFSWAGPARQYEKVYQDSIARKSP